METFCIICGKREENNGFMNLCPEHPHQEQISYANSLMNPNIIKTFKLKSHDLKHERIIKNIVEFSQNSHLYFFKTKNGVLKRRRDTWKYPILIYKK